MIDNALSPRVAGCLTAEGHDASHVRDRGLAELEKPRTVDVSGQAAAVSLRLPRQAVSLLVLEWSSTDG